MIMLTVNSFVAPRQAMINLTGKSFSTKTGNRQFIHPTSDTSKAAASLAVLLTYLTFSTEVKIIFVYTIYPSIKTPASFQLSSNQSSSSNQSLSSSSVSPLSFLLRFPESFFSFLCFYEFQLPLIFQSSFSSTSSFFCLDSTESHFH